LIVKSYELKARGYFSRDRYPAYAELVERVTFSYGEEYNCVTGLLFYDII